MLHAEASGVKSCADCSPLATAFHRQPDCQRSNGARSQRSASLYQCVTKSGDRFGQINLFLLARCPSIVGRNGPPSFCHKGKVIGRNVPGTPGLDGRPVNKSPGKPWFGEGKRGQGPRTFGNQGDVGGPFHPAVPRRVSSRASVRLTIENFGPQMENRRDLCANEGRLAGNNAAFRAPFRSQTAEESYP